MTAICLHPHTVCFFYTPLDHWSGRSLPDTFWAVISDREREKIARYRFEKARRTCLVTRALVRYVLSQCTGLGPETFDFKENTHGKPFLAPAIPDRPVQFNISHSHGICACALTLENAVGVDVEKQDRAVDPALARRFFSPDEAAWLERLPAARRSSAFFDLWTLKESFVKARGRGLSLGLENFSFDLSHDPVTISFHPPCTDLPGDFVFFRFSPMSGYKAAVTLQVPAETPCCLVVYACIPFESLTREMVKNLG